MNNLFLSAIKTKRLGRWCKAGAWCILGLGLLSVVLNTVYAWQMRIQYQVPQFYNIHVSQDSFSNFVTVNYFSTLPYFAAACQAAVLPIFLFVLLYGAGIVFSSPTASPAPAAQDTEDVVYESLEVATTRRR